MGEMEPLKYEIWLSKREDKSRKRHEEKIKYRICCEINNLSFKDFVKKDDLYIWTRHIHKGALNGSIKICINTPDSPSDIFLEKYTKNFKISGDLEHIRVKITVPITGINNAASNHSGQIGQVSYKVAFSGSCNQLMSKRNKQHKKSKKRIPYANPVKQPCSLSSSTNKTSIPSNVSWAASHPFQGGNFTPK